VAPLTPTQVRGAPLVVTLVTEVSVGAPATVVTLAPADWADSPEALWH